MSKHNRSRRYELVSCAFQGHALVGTDVAVIAATDDVVVRVMAGSRWHRCLRCDAWIPQDPPKAPTRETIPDRSDITLPDRGKALRDKYVLRLIALERLFHVILFGGVAVLLLIFGRDHAVFRHDYNTILNDFSGGDPVSVQARGLLGHLRGIFALSPGHVYILAALAAGYAVLEAVEVVGLWHLRRWAEYLTFVATTIFIPFEIYELVEKVSVFKVIALVINLAVVLYLLVAKRLFGLRGGHRMNEERRRRDMGWDVLERTAPPLLIGPGLDRVAGDAEVAEVADGSSVPSEAGGSSEADVASEAGGSTASVPTVAVTAHET